MHVNIEILACIQRNCTLPSAFANHRHVNVALNYLLAQEECSCMMLFIMQSVLFPLLAWSSISRHKGKIVPGPPSLPIIAM